MPGFNESNNIYNNLKLTENILNQFIEHYEIIFINDGSTDNTLFEAQRAASESVKIKIINSVKNSGKGNALRLGFMFATGEYVAFLDADLELNPRQLELFMKIMKEKDADVVIGSKLHPKSVTNYPTQRKIISLGYYIFLKIFFRLPIKDTQTGIKLFKYNALKNIFPRILVKKFAFDIELLANIHHKGFKIVEAPIQLDYTRPNLWGRIKIKDVINIFVDTLAIFYRLYILRYYDKEINSSIKEINSKIATTILEDGTIQIKE